MIGHDFEKIQLDIWGFHFLEPNALIGDIFLFSAALIIAAPIGDVFTSFLVLLFLPVAWVIFCIITSDFGANTLLGS